MSIVKNYYGDKLIEMKIQGCANHLCLHSHLLANIQLGNTDDTADLPVDNLVKQIIKETKQLPKEDGYNLSTFLQKQTIANTSETLLTFVSKLTCNVCTYGEVLRFHTSVTKCIGEQDYTARGLDKHCSKIGSLCDNYDLKVSTPNVLHETHAMVIEWRQQQGIPGHLSLSPNLSQDPQPEDEDKPFIIPCLSREEMKDLKLSQLAPVNMLHYSGPKKPNPPLFDLNEGRPYQSVVHTFNTIKAAVESDIQWPLTLIRGDKDGDPAVEWSSYMASVTREHDMPMKATNYIFGPVIDATPANPDTVLTTMTLVELFSHKHGQKYSYLEADMHIYKLTIHIKWSDTYRWQHMIIIPCGMHTLMSFLGIIGILMQGTGLETILNAAFHGVPNIMNEKAWPKAMRGLGMVVTVLQENIINAGKTTTEQIEDCLEDAHSHPTARLWVDCLVMPVIIAHLFVRAERTGDWRLETASALSASDVVLPVSSR